jgi:hypothetical protein
MYSCAHLFVLTVLPDMSPSEKPCLVREYRCDTNLGQLEHYDYE